MSRYAARVLHFVDGGSESYDVCARCEPDAVAWVMHKTGSTNVESCPDMMFDDAVESGYHCAICRKLFTGYGKGEK
jgi:hypothetical protein